MEKKINQARSIVQEVTACAQFVRGKSRSVSGRGQPIKVQRYSSAVYCQKINYRGAALNVSLQGMLREYCT
jgi:hypothetical protein